MPGQHSRIGASGAEAALACPGKKKAEEGFPNVGNFAAAQGTVFHEIVERCLRYGEHPDDHKFELYEVENDEEGDDEFAEPWTIMCDRSMHRHLVEGLAALEAKIEEMGGREEVVVYIERRVILEPWLGDGEFGTADVILVNVKRRWVVVWDWKYGIGVPVYPTWNLQAILYCLGAWHTVLSDLFDDDPTEIDVEVIIHQPRITGAGGLWETTMLELLTYGKQLPARAAATLEPDAPRIPGEKQCRFCRARRNCGERAAHHLRNVQMDFEDLDAADATGAPLVFGPVADLTMAQKGIIALHAKDFMAWVKEVQADIERDLRRGHDDGLPVKMVLGNRGGARFYRDKKAAAREIRKRCGDKGFTIEPISPTQLEEKFPDVYRDLEDNVGKGEKKPILVPKHDPRPALAGIADEFDDISGDDDYE